MDSLSKSKCILHSNEQRDTWLINSKSSEHSYYSSQEHKLAIQFWNRRLLLGVNANNCINLSIKSLSREILGLVCAARATSLSIANSKQAEIVLAVWWTTQPQWGVLTSISQRYELASLRHWKADKSEPWNRCSLGLQNFCKCTQWLCMTGNNLKFHQFLLLSEFKQLTH